MLLSSSPSSRDPRAPRRPLRSLTENPVFFKNEREGICIFIREKVVFFRHKRKDICIFDNENLVFFKSGIEDICNFDSENFRIEAPIQSEVFRAIDEERICFWRHEIFESNRIISRRSLSFWFNSTRSLSTMFVFDATSISFVIFIQVGFLAKIFKLFFSSDRDHYMRFMKFFKFVLQYQIFDFLSIVSLNRVTLVCWVIWILVVFLAQRFDFFVSSHICSSSRRSIQDGRYDIFDLNLNVVRGLFFLK